MPGTQPSVLMDDAQRYIDSLVVGESPVMARVRRRCEDEGLPAVSMHSGQVLRTLAAAAVAGGSGRVLEVGCLYGYSALWLASAAPHVRVDTIEMDPGTADVAEAHFEEAGVNDRVTVHRGRALDVLPLLDGPFDMVFLDAAKAEYVRYLDHSRRLLRPGGIVAADNVLWSGRVWDTRASDEDTEGLRRFTRAILEEPGLASTVLPVGDGMSVTVLVK